jgi:hypothetical protein
VGVAVGFSLRQFAAVFTIRDAAGRPYVLIGGQAVNYWAERYLVAEPELQQFQPFTSEDIDFKGNHEDVRRIAKQLALQPIFPPKVAITALSGTIPFQIGDLKSNIEVIRRVPGVPDSVDRLAFEAEMDGLTIRVLDPVSLLACKLELVASVSQEKRRDLPHLRMLVPCVRAFLGEFLQQVEAGQLPVRGWLGAANQVIKLTTSVRARKLAKKHGLDWAEILPLAAIAKSEHEKIRRFREQQLEKGYRKSNGVST